MYASVSRTVITTRSCIPYSLLRRITAGLAQCPQSADLIVVLVHTEVYMLTPHPEGKDAEVLLVTLKTLTLVPPSGAKVRCSTLAERCMLLSPGWLPSLVVVLLVDC